MSGTIHQLPLGDSGLLTLGAKGDAVKQLQCTLNALRVTFLGISETGVFDLETANAVKAFQSKGGLPTTGSVDSATQTALNKATAGQKPNALATRQVATTPAKPTLPLWQLGLMVLGGIALVGGALWAVTKDEGPEVKPLRARDSIGEGEATNLDGVHVKPLSKPTKVARPKCERLPKGEGELVT